VVFDQLVYADKTRLTPEGLARLQEFSRARVRCYPDDPASEGEILARIRDADGILVGWQTPISAEVLRAAPCLRYVGMCCSLYDSASANVDGGLFEGGCNHNAPSQKYAPVGCTGFCCDEAQCGAD
jgi:hypothetical protein